MRHLFYLSALFIALFSCTTPRQYFLDDQTSITRSQFKQISRQPGAYALRVNTPAGEQHTAVRREQKGRIDRATLRQIRADLQKVSGRFIDSTHTIVINYHHGLDKCLAAGNQALISESYLAYSMEMRKWSNVTQFSVYHDAKGLDMYGARSFWVPDQNGLIMKTFFPYHYPCGSYVLIRSDGQYYACKGEYAYERIYQALKDKSTFE